MELSCRDGYTKQDNCNGCGSGWSAKIIPNSIYGVDITEACCIHDDRYENGATIEYKDMADREFLNNMLRLIEVNDKWYYPTALARRRALKYYEAVKYFGGTAYWNGKA